MATEPWIAQDPVDVDLARRLIEDRFPETLPFQIRAFGAGWDNEAFIVDEQWVYRFPKRESTARSFPLEHAILPRLAEQIGTPIPVPERIGEPALGYPHPWHGYRLVQGKPAITLPELKADSKLAADIGRALKAIHEFPVEDAEAMGAPRISSEHALQSRRKAAFKRLPKIREGLEPGQFRALEAFLNDDGHFADPAPRPLTLCHDDLHEEHILIDDDGQLAGIIDWSDLAITNPISDFVGLRHWMGADFVEEVLVAYGPVEDADDFHRVMLAQTVCIAVIVIDFGIHGDRPDCLRAGLTALDRELLPVSHKA
jgi:aminoglycoside phosphotransferase (APT) family kinase protein